MDDLQLGGDWHILSSVDGAAWMEQRGWSSVDICSVDGAAAVI
jgi:hypothetical protein